MNSQPDQQSVSSESVSEQASEPQDHHGQENVRVQPEVDQCGDPDSVEQYDLQTIIRRE